MIALQKRDRGSGNRRQIVQVIVDRGQRTARYVEQQPVQTVFRLAGEQADAHVEGGLQIGLRLRQHRQAARNVKAADDDRHAGGAQRGRNVECARELVRLNAHQPDHTELTIARECGNDPCRFHPRIGLVDRDNLDVDVVAKHPPFGRIPRQSIKRC